MRKNVEDNRPSVMPRPLNASAHPKTIAAVLSSETPEQRDSFDHMCGRRPGEFERLGAFVLPPFQRPAVWTQEQKIRFMESVWCGYDIGRYVIVNDHHGYSRFTDCLIDGQQRIRAIVEYAADAFPVLGYRFSELPQVDLRQFHMSIIFPRVEIRSYKDEADLREMYNRMNYGGTPHTEDQRA